jgi:hypothetical protein
MATRASRQISSLLWRPAGFQLGFIVVGCEHQRTLRTGMFKVMGFNLNAQVPRYPSSTEGVGIRAAPELSAHV